MGTTSNKTYTCENRNRTEGTEGEAGRIGTPAGHRDGGLGRHRDGPRHGGLDRDINRSPLAITDLPNDVIIESFTYEVYFHIYLEGVNVIGTSSTN